MQRVTVTLDDDLMTDLDRMVEEHGYQNRSEAIRDFARAGMQQAAHNAGGGGECVAALVYIYDHAARDLSSKLVKNFHGHHDMSLASLHIHLDNDTCMEVTALRGHSPRQMMSHVGLPAWKLPFVAKDFIARMGESIHAIRPFDGVDAALARLADAGVALAVVSSNAYDNVSRVLGPATTRLFRHFECGMSMFGKTASLRSVLKKTGVHASEAIYVGDQSVDLQAARRAGIAFGAVAWGYATIESLREHRPEEEFASVAELARIA